MKWTQASSAGKRKKKKNVTFNEPSKNAGKFFLWKSTINCIAWDCITVCFGMHKANQAKRREKIHTVVMKRHYPELMGVETDKKTTPNSSTAKFRKASNETFLVKRQLRMRIIES